MAFRGSFRRSSGSFRWKLESLLCIMCMELPRKLNECDGSFDEDTESLHGHTDSFQEVLIVLEISIEVVKY